MGGPSASSSGLASFYVGSFYEIDHASLPPDVPAQLKGIRVVMVTDKTEFGLTASFPSVLSLREYFHNIDTDCYGSPASGASSSGGRGKQKLRHILTGPRPELDEQFVVGAAQAARVLRREVPLRELHDAQHLPAFWMVGSSFSSTGMMAEEEEDQQEAEDEEEERQEDEAPVAPAPVRLEEALRHCADVKRWGSRKKVRHMEDISHSTQRLAQVKLVKASKITVKEEQMEDVGDVAARIGRRKKRKVVVSRMTAKKKQEAEKPSAAGFVSGKRRWSAERYDGAERKLFDILRQMGAVRGHPVPRSRLREEARKHIGDTGLLDHLLKHMTGKVVQGGHERFRRRHDPDGGGMEYWLEDARFLGEDEDTGRKAGTKESCSCLEAYDIRDDLLQLKRDVKQLLHKQQLEEDEQGRSETAVEEERKQVQASAKREEDLLCAARDTAAATSAQILQQQQQQQQQQVKEWKGEVECRITEMLNSLTQTKEEMRQIREDVLLLKEQNQQLMSLVMQQFNGTNHQLPSPATASSGGGWVANGTATQTSQSHGDGFSMNTTMVTAHGSYVGATTSKAWSCGTCSSSCGMGIPSEAVERVMQDTFLWQGGGSGSCRTFDPCIGGAQLRACPPHGARMVAGGGWPLCVGPQQVPFHGASLPMQFPPPTQVPPPAGEQH